MIGLPLAIAWELLTVRNIKLSREEAEFIVEACEKDGAPQWFELEDTLRKQWGMGPRRLRHHPACSNQNVLHPEGKFAGAETCDCRTWWSRR